MNSTISIHEIFGADVRSRSTVTKLADMIACDLTIDVIDFSDVTFITRSVADEIYQIVKATHRQLKLVGQEGVVAVMLQAVTETNEAPRVHPIDNAVVKVFDNMKALSSYMRNS